MVCQIGGHAPGRSSAELEQSIVRVRPPTTQHELIYEARRFNSFVNSGWQFGGQSTVAAKAGRKGGGFAGAVSVSDGVWMYQLTDKGLAAELTLKSSKYSKNDDLN